MDITAIAQIISTSLLQSLRSQSGWLIIMILIILPQVRDDQQLQKPV